MASRRIREIEHQPKVLTIYHSPAICWRYGTSKRQKQMSISDSAPGQNFELRNQCTWKGYQDFCRDAGGRTASYKYFLAMAFSITIGGVAFYFALSLMATFVSIWVAVFISGPIVWYIVIRLFFKYSVSRQSKLNPEGKGIFCPEMFTFSEEGLKAISEFTESTVRWEQFLRLVERRDQFLLYTDPLRAYIIQKSSFESPSEADRWKAFADRKLDEVSPNSLWHLETE